MIEYILENGKGQTFELNTDNSFVELKKSWTQGSDTFEFDNKIVERSSLPGAAAVGKPRLKERDIELIFHHVDDSSGSYRTYMNKLLSFFAETIWLIDNTNKMRLSVVPQKADISYDDGSLKHSSENTLTFTSLSPFWETSEAQDVQYNSSGTDTKFHFYHDNSSVVSCQVTFLFTHSKNFAGNIKLTLEDTRQVFEAQNIINAYTIVIDGFKGELKIDNILDNSLINNQTGFFLLPPGRQKIIADITLKTSGIQAPFAVTVTTRPLSWL